MGRHAIEPGEHGPIKVVPVALSHTPWPKVVDAAGAPAAVAEWLLANPDTVLQLAAKLQGPRRSNLKWVARAGYRSLTTGKRVVVEAESDVKPEEARARLMRAIEDRRAAETGGAINATTTILQLVELLEKDLLDDEVLRGQTLDGYLKTLRRSMTQEFLGVKRVSEFTTADVNDFTRRLVKAGRRHDARVAKTLLARAFELAVDARAVAANPVRGAKPVPKGEKLAPRTTDVGHLHAIRNALIERESRKSSGPRPDGQHRAIFELWCATAARPNEVLAIRVRDVDIANGRLSLLGTITEDEKHDGRYRQHWGKTHSSSRILEVGPEVVNVLQRALNRLGPDPDPDALLFSQRDGGPHDLKVVTRAINLVAERAGLDGISGYVLRRTGATAVHAELDLHNVSYLLGHAEGDVSIARKHYVNAEVRVVGRETTAPLAKQLFGS